MDQPEHDPVPDEAALARLEADLDRVDAALAQLDADDLDGAEALVAELNSPVQETPMQPEAAPEPEAALAPEPAAEPEAAPEVEHVEPPIVRTLRVVNNDPDQA